MTDKTPDARTARAARQFENIDGEIARLTTICRVDFLGRTNLERVIRNDASVCGSNDPVASGKQRDLSMTHCATRTKTAAVLGEAETQAIVDSVVDRILARFARPGGGKP